MAKWVCSVCGYIYEGDAAPAECPVCHVSGDKFKKVEGELKLAAEHEFGIYASTVKNNPDISEDDKKYIFDQLKANFEGECSEVGMYLCMARIAHREGYPEIGLYWEKAAYEEAGVTYDSIVGKTERHFDKKVSKAEKLVTAYSDLQGKIQAGVNDAFAKDASLAGKFQEWSAN